MNLKSGTQAIDAQRWLRVMEDLEQDHLLTETGDLVTRFECERILGIGEYEDV